jgi:hypothetical protein
METAAGGGDHSRTTMKIAIAIIIGINATLWLWNLTMQFQ